MNTLVWIGFSQALFASILMITKSDRAVYDKILTTWLILLAIDFLTSAIDYQLFGVPLLSGTYLLFNPALYLYVRSLTVAGFRLKYRHLFHLLPFLVFEIMAYVIREPLLLGDYLVQNENYIFRFSFALASLVSWLIYSPLSITLVYNYRTNLQNETSYIETNENIRWLMSLTTFYVMYCIIGYIISFVVNITEDYHSIIPDIYNYSLLLVLVYMLSFYGLRQKHIPERLQIRDKKRPYKNPLLGDHDRKTIGEQVLEYFNRQKAYLNPGLNMDLLSSELKIPKHQLTEVLNVEIGKSFFRLVNSFRVEAVKKMLEDPGNIYSIEAIGYECGFSNKSSFFKIFKETVGETPLEYKKRFSND